MKNKWLSATVIIVLSLAMSVSQASYAIETTSTDNEAKSNDENQQQSTEVTKPNPESETTKQQQEEPKRQQEEQQSLPKCDGSRQDCVTENGDTCKAGTSTGHECECADDMHDCQNHPSVQHTSTPDASCDFHPNADRCKPDKDGNCPPGFSHNDKGNCHPSGPCPSGFHRVTDDESGTCFSNRDNKHRDGHDNHSNNNNNNNNPKHILRCNSIHDSCIGWCSTGKVDGTETIFCFREIPARLYWD